MEERVFGRRYRVTERVGAGGMAEVYKAVDEVLGRTVAVKVLHRQYAEDPSFVARFRQEAQSAANLSHPTIVNIYDWGRDDDTYFIVMEYVRGTDLKTLVEDKGAIDAVKAAEYAAQVCTALSVAHGYDIIHRDIKSGNIVLTPDGSIKVMDFGIVRAGNTTLTQTGSVLGTAQYLSPEQAQGRPLTPASDLYSLGIVLYELTTGRLPFTGDSPVAVALKQVNEFPIPPRQLDPDIPQALEAVIMRAMAKDPGQRYHSAEEMRDDLNRVVTGQAVPPAPTPAPTAVIPAVEEERVRERFEPRRRNWTPLLWVLFAMALLLVGLGVAWATGLLGPAQSTVPTVTGMTLPEATAALRSAELHVGDVTRQNSPSVQAGKVIDQDPPAGTRLEKGDQVDLVVSSGPAQTEVPNVGGLTEDEAIRALREAGLELGSIRRENSKDVPEDQVMRSEPAAGATVARESEVAIVISKGPKQVQVPDVAGKTTQEARYLVESAGLVVRQEEQFSDTVRQGRIIAQSPDPGVTVQEGSPVRIVVSKGKETLTVPDVIGKTESQAVSMLRDAGFEILVNYQPSPQDGIVLTQSPVPDQQAGRGETVTIWVGKSPSP